MSRDLLATIQQGTMAYRYRDLPTLKNPFDLALYPLLIERLRPRSIIEIGSYQGGSALWFADLLSTYGIDAHVHSVDVTSVTGLVDPRITFLAGDGNALERCLPDDLLRTLPRPWLVVEDSDHRRTTVLAVLRFFDEWLDPGDYLVVEDGILTDMGVADSYDGGPGPAIAEFLAERPGRYRIDRDLCDYFGHNVTWNVDGWLQRM